MQGSALLLRRRGVVGLLLVTAILGFDSSAEVHAAVTDPPRFSLAWGTTGVGDGEFSNPAGVALDASGNVYVADSAAHRIQKFDADGTFLSSWGSEGNGDGQFEFLYGITVDQTSGDVYATDFQNARVEKFDSGGTFVTSWGGLGTADGQFTQPEAITTDGSGNVYVADTGNFRIQKFDANGNHLLTFGGQGPEPGHFKHPEGIAVAPSGTIYVADPGNYRVQTFDASGTFLSTWGSLGTGPGQFRRPLEGLTLDDLGNVYVTDTANDRVQKFDASGNFLATWGNSGVEDGQFDFPYGIAINAQGDVYVSDFRNNRIQRFAQVRLPDGTIRRAGAGAVAIGDGVYNETGVGQARTLKVAPGRTRRFLVEIQNDGSFTDRFELQGCGSDPDFKIGYRFGSTRITKAVVNGTYQAGPMAPDSSRTIKVVITTGAGTVPGSTKRCLVTATSNADPVAKDAVQAGVTVT